MTRINPSVDSTSRTFQVEAVVPNDEGKLRPGGFAKASIVTNRADDAITVPLEAVVKSKGITKLFLVGDDRKARSIAVETGLQGSGWIEVIGGVPAGAKVVTTGQVQLADGITTVTRAPEASDPRARPEGAAQAAALAKPAG